MDILNQISEALQQGDDEQVFALTRQAIDASMPPREILDNGLIVGMNVIGEKFRKHQVFLPDVLLAAKAMYSGMNQLKPLFENQNIPHQGKVVIGTVYGDLHDIGKNLVGIMLKGAGFSVVDLGKNVSAEQFIEAAVKEQATVIGMSALLTTTMIEMKRVVELLNERGLNGKIRTIVGGASTSERFAREINADAYGFDAVKAVERVRELIAN
jgi:5-methyltetrahydrofolate--homocysteine methyltransferase